MPDPISPFSQFQKSAASFQRPQGAMSSGDAQDALKSLQDMLGNNSASNNGTPNASNTTNSGLDGLLKNPSIQGLLQKGLVSPGAAVQGTTAAQDANTAGNRTLTEDTALSFVGISDSGFDSLNGGAVAPAFGDVIHGFVQNVNASQEKSAQMIESLALGEPVDVHQVMLALNEANNAMALTLQVRSHALKAYQDLMQISL
ncbi:flagellar hook-basal body complex protein FliE [Armatimonas sp.]|uniref:flagellar hook-basal body complex protein FliE n=1 Tax=Armatimonas sp. TaxID=1872638 RepID=UPI003753C45C